MIVYIWREIKNGGGEGVLEGKSWAWKAVQTREKEVRKEPWEGKAARQWEQQAQG